MKWRQSMVYLILLVLLGGYFYYFEVVKKQEEEAAEKEAKKVFHVKADDIKALDIQAKDKKPVQLTKEAAWQITTPLRTEVDEPAVKGLLSSLSGLESEREIVASAEDLKQFGLQEPSYKLRFQTGDQWSDLLVGDKNPVGGGYYAKVGDKPNIFLIPDGSWSGLNKGLEDLRRHTLFSFQADEVSSLKVVWQDGGTVTLKRSEKGGVWQDPDRPEVKIKDSKVKNAIEQVQWLRAKKFLEDGADKLEAHGLHAPHATVEFMLTNDSRVELKLVKKDKDENQLVALSSELPAVVEVDGDFLEDLPKTLQDLEDRSILSLKKEDVKEVKWEVGEKRGAVVQAEENKWSLTKGDGAPEPLNDAWRVSSLLWDLDEAEFEKKVEPAPPVPENPHARVEFKSGEKTLQTLIWSQTSEKEAETTHLWILSEGSPFQAVIVGADEVEKLEQDLKGFTETPQPGK